MRLQPLILTGAGAIGVSLLASCHASYHPFEVADSCHCAPGEFCRIRPSAANGADSACLPIPQTCSDPPTCACLGQPVDACREELGRFWVFERRSVDACDACSTDEYCVSTSSPAGPRHQCGLLPPQCDGEATCACFMRTRRHQERITCDDARGRIEVSLLSPR